MNQEELDSIKGEIQQLLAENQADEEKTFDRIYQILARTFGIKLYFCKIQGKRWAYLAGNDDMITPEKQLQLSKRHGILYNTPSSNKEDWAEILDFLKEQLK